MEFLVVFLAIILALLVVASVGLAVVAIALSRNISRAQHNVKNISSQVDKATTVAGLATSLYGTFVQFVPKKMKKSPRRTKNK